MAADKNFVIKMKGKEKCDLLNEIRQKIADENNIDFNIEKCTFKGECTGTCPKCEVELEYLENELEKKQNDGEKIKLNNVFKFDEDENLMEIPFDDVYLVRKHSNKDHEIALGWLFDKNTPRGNPSHYVLKKH